MFKGTDPAAPVRPTAEQHTMIQRLSSEIVQRAVDRLDPDLPIDLTILHGSTHILGALTQCKKKKGEKIRVLEWIFTSLQPKTTIQEKTEDLAEIIKKGRSRILQIIGAEPHTIYLPVKREDLEWWLRNSPALQSSLLTEAVEIKLESIKAPVLKWISNNSWMERPKRKAVPIIEAVTVYTDAGKRSRRAAATWHEDGQWKYQLIHAEPCDSLQTLELAAVVWTFSRWMMKALNVVTDSLYVAGIVNRIEDAHIKEVQNLQLFELLRQLQSAIKQRTLSYCIIHIRSHQWTEGLGEGNDRADKLVAITAPVSEFAKARESHQTFHQNARGLKKQFQVTMEEARGIVRACPTCSHHGPGIGLGVNPRGLQAREIWQMDVTHLPGFGKLKYVHVTIDTYSKFLWATAQSGERAVHVIRH